MCPQTPDNWREGESVLDHDRRTHGLQPGKRYVGTIIDDTAGDYPPIKVPPMPVPPKVRDGNDVFFLVVTIILALFALGVLFLPYLR